MIPVVAALAAAAAPIMLGMAGVVARDASVRQRLPQVGRTRSGEPALQSILERLGSRIAPPNAGARSTVTLASSGNLEAGTRVAAAGVGSVTGLLLGALLGIPAMVFLGALGAVVGLRLPGMAGGWKRHRRARAINAELPLLVDLLAATSAAGLSALIGLRRTSSAVRGPLAEELAVTIRAVDLGGAWREELDALATRCGLRDVRRVVTTILRTERLGSSLSEALRDMSADVREARRSRAAEAARKAPVKMLFPLVFLILPAFLLLTVVPVLIATLRSIN